MAKPQLVRCPGCLETYDPKLTDTIIIIEGQPLLFGERFTDPDGKVYCTSECFEENGH